MAGKPGKSGRNRSIGKVYEFHFYYNLDPATDPPELETLLDFLIQAKGRKRRDILRSALLGGAQQAQVTAARTDDSEILQDVGDMFANF